MWTEVLSFCSRYTSTVTMETETLLCKGKLDLNLHDSA